MKYNYEYIFLECRNLFIKKMNDYHFSWIHLNNYSMIDQIFIKVIRIKNIYTKNGITSVKNESIKDTYLDIINYLIIALIKLDILNKNFSKYFIIKLYDKNINELKNNLNKADKNYITSINYLFNDILYIKEYIDLISYDYLKEKYLHCLIKTVFLLEKYK